MANQVKSTCASSHVDLMPMLIVFHYKQHEGLKKNKCKTFSHIIIYSTAEDFFTFDYTYKSTLVNKLWNDRESGRFHFNTKIIWLIWRQESIHTMYRIQFIYRVKVVWFIWISRGKNCRNESRITYKRSSWGLHWLNSHSNRVNWIKIAV